MRSTPAGVSTSAYWQAAVLSNASVTANTPLKGAVIVSIAVAEHAGVNRFAPDTVTGCDIDQPCHSAKGINVSGGNSVAAIASATPS